jgi:uncharacterized protein
MSNSPEDNLKEPALSPPDESAPAEAAGATLAAGEPTAHSSPGADVPAPYAGSAPSVSNYATAEAPPPIFQSWVEPPKPPIRRPARTPHFGDFALLLILLLLGGLATGIVMGIAMYAHLFGFSTSQRAMTDVHFLLGSEALLYLFSFAACLIVFPLFWHRSLFAGLQWNGATAIRLSWRLVGAASVCFVLALLNGVLIPSPTNAPIEQIFRTPGAAWLLFGFGVTFAPFFEETFFRGFLLPSFCTAYDWFAEALSGHNGNHEPLPGRPRWPVSAQLIAAALMAIPIAATCAFPRSGHYRMRLLAIALWALALTLGWVIGRAEFKSRPPRFVTVDANGHPVWSISAMAVSSVLVSVPFALLHAQQTGYSIGPFLLLVGVSLVLCGVRLVTRSLASSVVVHACYNFLLFAFMFVGTGGFRHLDKM